MYTKVKARYFHYDTCQTGGSTTKDIDAHFGALKGKRGNIYAQDERAAVQRLTYITPRIERRPSVGATHVGRGGAANVVKPSPEPKSSPSDETPVLDGPAKEQDKEKQKKDKERGLAAKARDFFRLT